MQGLSVLGMLSALLVSTCAAEGVWELRRDDMGGQNQRPPVHDGIVTINPDGNGDAFPRYLNEIGVEQIRLRFSDFMHGTHRLTAVWNGGTMGPDGFDVSLNGERVGGTGAVDTARYPGMWRRSEFLLSLTVSDEHVIEIVSPSDTHSAVQFAGFQLADPEVPPYAPLCYESAGSLDRYQEGIGEPGVAVESEHVYLFAPRRLEPAARELSAFLERAYAEFAQIHGGDMMFTFSVDHYPEGHPQGWGGISGQATIGYPISALERFDRLRFSDLRGVVGYTEEMSHAFLNLHGCAGTYEALGRAVQEEVLRRLRPREVCDAFWLPEHRLWAETHRAYLAADRQNPDPRRFPWNLLYTRILNNIFRQMRDEHGPRLWPEFFAMIEEMDYPLHAALPSERMGIYADILGGILGRNMRPEWTRQGIDFDVDPPWGWESDHPPE